MRISILLIFLLSSTQANAATFTIQNNCPITIWPAAVPGGGRRLELGQTWTLSVSNGTSGRIWARTSCSFTRSGQGRCLTGDCDGLLQCQAHGAPPNTLVEYSLNQFNDLDYLDISLVDGFNVPIEISPSSGTRSSSCRAVRCVADINGQCPRELRAAGGCNNPCTVYNNQTYCCTNSTGHCGPTAFSMFFKERCQDAFSYPLDDSSSTFVCGGGNNYRVVFCP